MISNKKILKKYSDPEPNFLQKEDRPPEFHVNTLLYIIYCSLEAQALRSKEGWELLIDWVEETKTFASNLPHDILKLDTITASFIDPFMPCREGFKQQEGKKNNQAPLYLCVCQMHNACKGSKPTEHRNLLEVLANSKLIDRNLIKRFCEEEL